MMLITKKVLGCEHLIPVTNNKMLITYLFEIDVTVKIMNLIFNFLIMRNLRRYFMKGYNFLFR